jgi:hydroxymethylbilane synthase
MTSKLVIGTRGSDLALWQAEHVKTILEPLFPDRVFAIRIIRTTGDDQLDIALSKIGDKGLFTRQIESELLSGSIDLAVHSLKDLQTEQPAGLVIGAVCKRETSNDILVAKNVKSIADLPMGARIATGSLRRRSQLLHFRPDLEIVEIRGNVPTRLRKFDESDFDGMLLAYAGVHRLGFDNRISELIDFDVMLPAVGQGAVAVEVRESDEEVLEVVRALEHRETRYCISAERAFLRTLEGGCQVPIGAHGTFDSGQLTLEGFVGSLDGRLTFRDQIIGKADEADALGRELADRLIAKGAADLLADARVEAESRSGAL